jgi:hypothetical protein
MSSARKVSLILSIVAVVLVVTVTALFVVQNSGRVTDLSLDLYFFATHLRQPVPVPYLLLGALGGGFVFGGGFGVVSRFQMSGKVRDLESRAARADLRRTDDDDWT